MTPFDVPILRGKFIRRYKRFFVDVLLEDGAEVVVHNPNTGSMKGLLDLHNSVLISHNPSPKRKLAYTLQAISDGSIGWVGVNTHFPNRVVAQAIEMNGIVELQGYPILRREVKYGREGRSRIDVHLSGHDKYPDVFVEVKNVTLKEGGIAQFPDAVTTRGQKHLKELMEVAKEGARAVMLFVVPRLDCEKFSAAKGIDPTYADLLDDAKKCGVEVLAINAVVDACGWRLDKRLQVL